MRLAALSMVLLLGSCTAAERKLLISGEEHTLRSRPPNARQRSGANRPPVMILGLDGVSRDLLYDMIRRHELPALEALIGPEAYFDETMISALPSTTMPAWVTAMTGVGPAEHGVTGNEFFIREIPKLACPAPVSFHDSSAALEIYTKHSLDELVEVPTLYERLRETDPDIQIWVSMNHLFRGADRLLLPRRRFLLRALVSILGLPGSTPMYSRAAFAALDEAAIDSVISRLRKERVPPDLLTVYISGTDLYAHIAKEGPDEARRAYLKDIIDPAIDRLNKRLDKRGMLRRMYTFVVADHGHTQVLHDESHAIGQKPHPAVAVLTRAGFRLRPFHRRIAADTPYSAVLAYGGATAYVYLADRSHCPGVCNWKLPPRYEEDVLPAADALFRANRDGPMRDTLDLILTRRPRPYAEVDLPFEVYVGDGRTVPVEDYLRDHPHPTYVAVAERLRALAVGKHGERAGDIMLITHDGDKARPEDRYYFAEEYRSWHGSPSRSDSEIPLIVGSRLHSRDQLRTWVQGVLGDEPWQSKLTDLIVGVRSGVLDR